MAEEGLSREEREAIEEEAAGTASEAISEHFSANSETVNTIAGQSADNAEEIAECARSANEQLEALKTAWQTIVAKLSMPTAEPAWASGGTGEIAVDNVPSAGLNITPSELGRFLNSLKSHVSTDSQTMRLTTGGQGARNYGMSRAPVPNNKHFSQTTVATFGNAIYELYVTTPGPFRPSNAIGSMPENITSESGGDWAANAADRMAIVNVQLDNTLHETRRGNFVGRERTFGALMKMMTGVSNWPLNHEIALILTGESPLTEYLAQMKDLFPDRVMISHSMATGEESNLDNFSYCNKGEYPTGWQSALMLYLKLVATLIGESTENVASAEGIVLGSTQILDTNDDIEAIMKAEVGAQRINYGVYRTQFEDGERLTRLDHGSYLGNRPDANNSGGVLRQGNGGNLVSSLYRLGRRLSSAADDLTTLADSAETADGSSPTFEDAATNSAPAMMDDITATKLRSAAAIVSWIVEIVSPIVGGGVGTGGGENRYNSTGLAAAYFCILRAADEQAEINDQIQDLIKEAAGDEIERPDWYESCEGPDCEQKKRAYDNALSAAFAARERQAGGATTTAATEALNLARVEQYLFNEQCFLLAFVDIFAKYKAHLLDPYMTTSPQGSTLPSSPTALAALAKANKRLPYLQSSRNVDSLKKNASILVDGDPYAFINKLTLSPKLQDLMDIPNHALSSIQPRIRLFKVVYPQLASNDPADAYEVEMDFDSYMTESDLNRFLSTNGQRGVGAGIKSFNFTYEGSNPFAVKKSIKANLKIFANSMEELFVERTGINSNGVRADYKYVDLVLKTGGNALLNAETAAECPGTSDVQRQNIQLADLNFRLKAQVGLATPPADGDTGALSTGIRDALKESFVTLNLTPTVHNFEIDELGRVILNINYLAYAEEFFDSAHFNIFADAKIASASPTTLDLIALRRLQRSMALEHVARKCDSSAKQQVREDFKKEIAKDTRRSISHLMESMINTKKVRFLQLPTNKIGTLSTMETEDKIALHAEVTTAVFGADPSTGTGVIANTDSSTGAELTTQINNALAVFEEEASGDTAGTETAPPSDEEGGTPPADEAIAAALMSGDYINTTLTYFYLSDLVDMILANIDTELGGMAERETIKAGLSVLKTPNGASIALPEATIEQKVRELQATKEAFERLRILLGPVEFTSLAQKNLQVTLGDLPISVKYFVEFLTAKMLKKNESLYSLTKFLNDIFNVLVRDFLNGSDCGIGARQKVRVQQAALTSYAPRQDSGINPDGTYDIVTLSTSGVTLGVTKPDDVAVFRTNIDQLSTDAESQRISILNISGPEGSAQTTVPLANEFNFFVYFAGQVQPAELMKGIRTEDEPRGVFHYLLGRPNGLIKNIKLSKTQTKGLAEVRFEQDGYDGLQQMRVIYDVQIDSYANVNTWPGTYIYVDPKGFLPHSQAAPDITKLGIGGYYMIIRSEHEFGPGNAGSTIHAKWVNSIENDRIAEECREAETSAVGSGDQENPSCRWADPPETPEQPEPPGALSMIWTGIKSVF